MQCHPLSTLAPLVSLQSTVTAQSRPANDAHPSKRKLCQQPSNRCRRMSPTTRCKSFLIVCQHSNQYKICTHPSKLPTPTQSLTLWPRLPREGANLTFTWCPSHYGVSGSELSHMVVKEGTIVQQQGENHHLDSAKAAIRQVTKEHPISHEQYGRRLRNTLLATSNMAGD